MDSKDFFEVLVLGAVAVGTGIVIYKYYRNKEEKGNLSEKPTGKSRSEIYKKLLERVEKDTQELKEKAVRFHIFNLISKYNFSFEEEKEIFDKYPKQYSKPYFPLYDLFGEEIDIFEDILKEKMRSANYNKTEGLLPKDAYENMILEEAEKEAKRILDEYESKFGKQD